MPRRRRSEARGVGVSAVAFGVTRRAVGTCFFTGRDVARSGAVLFVVRVPAVVTARGIVARFGAAIRADASEEVRRVVARFDADFFVDRVPAFGAAARRGAARFDAVVRADAFETAERAAPARFVVTRREAVRFGAARGVGARAAAPGTARRAAVVCFVVTRPGLTRFVVAFVVDLRAVTFGVARCPAVTRLGVAFVVDLRAAFGVARRADIARFADAFVIDLRAAFGAARSPAVTRLDVAFIVDLRAVTFGVARRADITRFVDAFVIDLRAAFGAACWPVARLGVAFVVDLRATFGVPRRLSDGCFVCPLRLATFEGLERTCIAEDAGLGMVFVPVTHLVETPLAPVVRLGVKLRRSGIAGLMIAGRCRFACASPASPPLDALDAFAGIARIAADNAARPFSGFAARFDAVARLPSPSLPAFVVDDVFAEAFVARPRVEAFAERV